MQEDNERHRRRNNVIVSRLFIKSDNNTEIKNTMRQFFAKEVGVKTDVRAVLRVRKDLHIVQVANEFDKAKILKNKYELFNRGVNVLLYPDRTREEAGIQSEISKFAKEEEAKGSRVKFGYRSLIVNGVKWIWDDDRAQLVQVTIHSRHTAPRYILNVCFAGSRVRQIQPENDCGNKRRSETRIRRIRAE